MLTSEALQHILSNQFAPCFIRGALAIIREQFNCTPAEAAEILAEAAREITREG